MAKRVQTTQEAKHKTHHKRQLNGIEAIIRDPSQPPVATFVKTSPAPGKVFERMASLPSSRRAIQWAESPPQVHSSESLIGADEDDAESLCI